jgi:hypothetical protein
LKPDLTRPDPTRPDLTRPDLKSKCFFRSTPLPTRLFRALLIITQLEIRTESQLALENEFFSDRRLSLLDAVRGLSYYQPARDSKPDPTRPDLNSKFFFRSTPLPTRLFGALLLSTSSRFETRPDPTRPDLTSKCFFLIDALAHLTRFGGSLIITQLEIRTESQLALENEFFSDRHLSLLDAVRDYHPARDLNREPTCIGKIIFFSYRRLSPLNAVRGLSYNQPARDSKPDPT